MSVKNTTETPENVNLADENSTTTIKIVITKNEGRNILTSMGVPIPNQSPDEIHLIINRKEND